MNAEQLVQWGTNAAFLTLFAAVGVNAVRSPTRLAVDAALLFGALGVVILQGLVFSLFHLGTIPLVQDAVVTIVVLLPYLTLRLAQDFSSVARWTLWASLASALVIGAVAFATPALPAWIGIALAAQFIGFEAYAGWAFWRASRRAVGATRVRLRAAALGSLLLSVAVVLAGLRSAIPALGAVSVQAFALASAVAYFLAFSPPGFVRRAWREPHLRTFLAAVARASARADTAVVVSELERGIAAAMGAEDARLLPVDEAAGGAHADEDSRALLRDALGARRAVLRDRPSGSLVAASILGSTRPLGTIVVRFGRSQAFPDESLALLDLLSEQAAVVLEAAHLRDEVNAASRAKSEFLANMSHELRTPLNAILGFSTLMHEQASLAQEKRDRYLRNISDAGEHLLALINDVLDLSKVEAGRVELRPDRTTLAVLAEPVLAAIRVEAERAGVTFAAELSGAKVVRVDAQRIHQILLNLLSNAVKFTPAGGSVALRLATSDADLVAEVSDTGIGISADRQGRVFGVFERVNEDRSEASGTGLGLALTKQLVELHGGSIGFTSVPDAGTTFRVLLPGVVAEAMDGERVLVVEDVEGDAELIRALAARHGQRCEVVATVAGALEALERGAPVAVVLDLRLPDGRGEQVLEAVRSAAATRHVPVAVVTVEDDAPAARALGVSLLVTKPIDMPQLSRWLAGLRSPDLAQAAS